MQCEMSVNQKPRRVADRGQGVVEYAGSLVIAAMIVSIAMFVVPEQVSSMINDIVTNAITYFTGQLPS